MMIQMVSLTAYTTNPVPFYIVGANVRWGMAGRYRPHHVGPHGPGKASRDGWGDPDCDLIPGKLKFQAKGAFSAG